MQRLKVIKQMRLRRASSLHVSIRIIQRGIESGGDSIDAEISLVAMRNFQDIITKVGDEAPGMIALAGFFYPPSIARKVGSDELMIPILQSTTKVKAGLGAYFETETEIEQAMQAGSSTTSLKERHEAEVEHLLRDLRELLSLCDELNRHVDELVAEIRWNTTG